MTAKKTKTTEKDTPAPEPTPGLVEPIARILKRLAEAEDAK